MNSLTIYDGRPDGSLYRNGGYVPSQAIRVISYTTQPSLFLEEEEKVIEQNRRTAGDGSVALNRRQLNPIQLASDPRRPVERQPRI